MKILISPAKSLNYNQDIELKNHSIPKFLSESKELITQLKSYSENEISSLMKISDNLAKLNHERYQNFKTPFTKANSKPALFVFNGDVYDAIEVQNYNERQLNFAQSNLRILSGLYGILKPLDLMQPYRLEMSTKLKNSKGGNLYDFWQEKLTNHLESELKKDEYIVNLASEEYSKAVKLNSSGLNYININFKEFKSGKFKIIGIFAKKARGKMVDYLIKNNIENINDIKIFDIDGYYFNPDLSDNKTFTFCRKS